MSRGQCPNCADPDCPGPEVLREYQNWTDLVQHCGEETITKWVNAYVEVIEARRFHGKKYRLRQQALAKLALASLDPDEIEAINRRVKGASLP